MADREFSFLHCEVRIVCALHPALFRSEDHLNSSVLTFQVLNICIRSDIFFMHSKH